MLIDIDSRLAYSLISASFISPESGEQLALYLNCDKHGRGRLLLVLNQSTRC